MPRTPAPAHRAQPEAPACTCGRLRRLTRRLTAVYDRTLAPCGLRVTQYSLLSHLATQRAWTLAALAEAMDMERTTLLRNLRPLVSSGWVRVQARPNTRKQEVTLTPSGRAKRAQARSLWRIAQNAVAATLGPAEVQRLHRRVDRYLARLRHPQPEA